MADPENEADPVGGGGDGDGTGGTGGGGEGKGVEIGEVGGGQAGYSGVGGDDDFLRLPSRAIVAGYGPVGRVVTDRLESAGVAVKVVDLNLETIESRLRLGKPAMFGDVTEREVLVKAGIDQADALILAIPNEDVVVRACRLARSVAPKIFIAARTNFVSKGFMAKSAGADHVTIEEVVTAESMGAAVIAKLMG